MVINYQYTPQKGDLVWLNFVPQTGREQSGRRPAIVISNSKYNEKTGLAIFCPITSKIKGYPFEVKLPVSSSITGVILADQVKSLDWAKRNIEFIEQLDDYTIKETIKLINKIIA